MLAGANQTLSTRKVQELIGCRTEYAVRLRNAVQPKGEDGDGSVPAGAR